MESHDKLLNTIEAHQATHLFTDKTIQANFTTNTLTRISQLKNYKFNQFLSKRKSHSRSKEEPLFRFRGPLNDFIELLGFLSPADTISVDPQNTEFNATHTTPIRKLPGKELNATDISGLSIVEVRKMLSDNRVKQQHSLTSQTNHHYSNMRNNHPKTSKETGDKSHPHPLFPTNDQNKTSNMPCNRQPNVMKLNKDLKYFTIPRNIDFKKSHTT